MEKEEDVGESSVQRGSESKQSKKITDTLPLPGINLDLERERAYSLAQRPAGELTGISKQRFQSMRQMQTPLDTQLARSRSPATDRLGLKKKERSATLNSKISDQKMIERRSS